MNIAIIDYKMGNLFSVQHACKAVGLKPVVTTDRETILNSDGAILPGVGAFGRAMNHLKELDLITTIYRYIETGKPFLGICLGMQLLFTESEEFGATGGLDLVRGKVLKFPNFLDGKEIKVPQIGWNRIEKRNVSSTILDGIDDCEYMYFVHSFYSKPADDNNILTLTNYEGIHYCSAIISENIIATQYHPEKSSKKGIQFYQNWANIVKERT